MLSKKKLSTRIISLDRAAYKFWLVKRGLTQRALSLKIGVAEGQLASLMHRDQLPLATAKAIARTLRVDLAQLTEDSDGAVRS